jgi:prolipoprotein diacylglyceryltransferase
MGAHRFMALVIDKVRAGDPRYRQALAAMLPARYPSQLFEAALEGLVLSGLLLIVWCKPRKPLVLSGWFCLGYGILRIVGEFFRMPDAQIMDREFAHWHITRGQWLSAILSLAGVVMIALASRRHVEPMGGWRAQGAVPTPANSGKSLRPGGPGR